MTQPERELPEELRSELRQGHDLVARGRFGDAVPGLARIVEAYPSCMPAQALLGRALRMLGDRQRSASVFRRAAEIDPNDAGILLGLAWVALDEERHDEAESHARRLERHPIHSGDALAIIARVREARGDAAGAAAAFLAAYQARPMWRWLEEHCRLAGRPFVSPAGSAHAPWPIAAPLRLWLYAHVEAALLDAADALPQPPPIATRLAAGCDHTPRWTTVWAAANGVDVIDLYQATSTRGGFCDCEVLLNAARDDDECLGSLLLAARVAGRASTRIADALGDLLVLDRVAPPSPEALARGSDVLFARRTSAELLLPPQVSSASLLGTLMLSTAGALGRAGSLSCLVLYPDGRERGHMLVWDAGGLSIRELVDDSELGAMQEWFVELARGLPVAPTIDAGARLSLPAPSAVPRLLCSGAAWLTCSSDGAHRSELGERPACVALHPSCNRIAWLAPNRKRFDLIVEDRRAGVRRRLASDRFATGTVSFPALAFTPDGEHVITSIDDTIVELDLEGHRRIIGPGKRAAPSPDGKLLAIEDATGTLRVIDRADGSVAMSIDGRGAVWSPDSRALAFNHRTDAEGWQLFVWAGTGPSRRVSPPCRTVDWPSFTRNGQELVFYIVADERRHPIGDGKLRVEQDERLVSVALDGSRAPRTLLALDAGYMRIRRPLAHPEQPIVAYATQDGPVQNRRVAALDARGHSTIVSASDHMPAAWLPESFR